MSSLKGQEIEAKARHYLEAQGLKTLETNFNSHVGEIDLIMEDSTDLVFVEVRYRKSPDHGSALESITTDKLRKLRQTAKFYLQSTNQYDQRFCRFDVVAFDLDEQPEWLKDVA